MLQALHACFPMHSEKNSNYKNSFTLFLRKKSCKEKLTWYISYNSQNVNHFVDIPTFTDVFWFKLVQINVRITKHLTDLKHRHLAGAFFLALIPDNNSVSFGYLYVLIVLIHMQYRYLEQIKTMRAYLSNRETLFF